MRIPLFTIATLLIVALGATPAQAESLPTYPLDVLADQADVIVVAEPLEAHPTGKGLSQKQRYALTMRFRVQEVIKGTDAARGDEIPVGRITTYVLPPSPQQGTYGVTRSGPIPKITKALLFLKRAEMRDGKRLLTPVLSGIRYLTATRVVLRPLQHSNPGPLQLVTEGTASWRDTLLWVREDLVRIGQVRALRLTDDVRKRNAALLAFLREHRDDPLFTWRWRGKDTAGGFGDLHVDAVKWILESCVPEDAWTAIRWVNRKQKERWGRPDRYPSTFESADGRRFLVAIAKDKSLGVHERRLALRYLAAYETLRSNVGPGGIPKGEVEALRTAVAPLAKDASFREDAQRVLEALQGVPGPRRDPATYSDPHRMQHMYLYPPDAKGGRLQVRGPRVPVFERPTLVLERLDANDVVAETRRMPVPIPRQEPRWAVGWTTWDGGFTALFPTKDLKPGRWRVRLEGFAGGKRVPWRSENHAFVWLPKK